MTKRMSNPRAKCPKCGKFMELVKGKWGGGHSRYICKRCNKGFWEFEVKEFNPRGGNPMAKKTRRPRQMKILGIPVITVAIVGGLAWWLTRKP